MRLVPLPSAEAVGLWSARYIAQRIRTFAPTEQRPFVLGLPTGSTPLQTYRQLIRMHRNENLSFRHVITFNMDEYVGLDKHHPCSYRTFMQHEFFQHIDIPSANINHLDGTAKDLAGECTRYENCILKTGGINLFLGGVGHDGHIAFNMPMSSLVSRTRIKTLSDKTRQANARFFNNDVSSVPEEALTVGIGTLMDADEIMIIATGSGKAIAIREAIEGAISQIFPVTALQQHSKTLFVCDDQVVSELKVKTLRYFQTLEKNEITPFITN